MQREDGGWGGLLIVEYFPRDPKSRHYGQVTCTAGCSWDDPNFRIFFNNIVTMSEDSILHHS